MGSCFGNLRRFYDLTQIEGTLMWDEPHKAWDDTRNAIKDGGLNLLFGELLIAMNVTQGAWQGASFFGRGGLSRRQ